MANRILLKKSSTQSKTPLVGDLEYGELAINYTDGKLHYKTASNAVDTFSSNTATATLTNKTLSSTVLTGTLTAGGSVGTSGQILTSTSTGVEWANSASGYSGLVEISQTGITTSTTLYSASATTYRGAKYTIQITNNTAYAMYEFLVMHDGTNIYMQDKIINNDAYSNINDEYNTGNYAYDYVDTLAISKIIIGTTYHALNWAITGGNLVFSASCSSGTISVKGTALLIKA